MEYQRLYEIAEALNANLGAKAFRLSNSDSDYINTVYLKVMGRPFKRSGCNSCEFDAVVEIISKLNKKEMNKFQLKRGAIAQAGGILVSRRTEKDEIVIQLLAKNPKLITKFEVFPANWQELVKAYTDTLDQPIQTFIGTKSDVDIKESDELLFVDEFNENIIFNEANKTAIKQNGDAVKFGTYSVNNGEMQLIVSSKGARVQEVKAEK